MSAFKGTPGPWDVSVVRGWGKDAHIVATGWHPERPMFQATAHPSRYYRHTKRKGRDGTEWMFLAEATPEGDAEAARREAEMAANARLIAAAPDLLEALEDLASLAEVAMREVGEYDIEAELADARAAIAKATGGEA